MRSAHCALPSDRQPKIQPAIATFSAGEFRRQPALSDNTGSYRHMYMYSVAVWCSVCRKTYCLGIAMEEKNTEKKKCSPCRQLTLIIIANKFGRPIQILNF